LILFAVGDIGLLVTSGVIPGAPSVQSIPDQLEVAAAEQTTAGHDDARRWELPPAEQVGQSPGGLADLHGNLGDGEVLRAHESLLFANNDSVWNGESRTDGATGMECNAGAGEVMLFVMPSAAGKTTAWPSSRAHVAMRRSA
jgi:hypothetical protein